MSLRLRLSSGRLVAGRRLAAVALLFLGAPCAASAWPTQELSSPARGVAAERTSSAPGTPETAPPPARSSLARAFDWTVGTWKGIRRDGADGSESPMTMIVEPILGGGGQTRKIEVEHGGGTYRGFAVQVPNESRGIWVRRYVNEGRGTFSGLEGKVEGDRSVWLSVTPGRARESRLVSERRTPDRWTRTMSVSTDGGGTWTILWIDELRRTTSSPP